MRWALRLFGLIPLLTLDAEYDELEYEEYEPPGMEGGSSHNFSLSAGDVPDEVPGGEPWDGKAQFGFRGPL